MFKKGDLCVKILHGAGLKTATIQKVERVTKGQVRLVGVESLRFSNETGREVDPAITGFYSEIVPLDGDEEEKIRDDAF